MLQDLDGLGNRPTVVNAPINDQFHHIARVASRQRAVFGVLFERPPDYRSLGERIGQRLEHAAHHHQVLGLNGSLDRIQGRRPVFVFGNPIIKTLCATVGFSDVTSANVVGYTEANPVSLGRRAAGVSFFNIQNGAATTLGDLKISGYDPEEGTDGDADIQTLTPGGKTDKSYKWVDFWDDEEGPLVHWYGWYSMDVDPETYEDDCNDVPLNPGDGVWLYAKSGLKIQGVGAVPAGSVKTYLPASGTGRKFVVNPMPMETTLGKLVVFGYDPEEGSDGEVDIQTLNPGGTTNKSYKWVDFWDDEEGPLVHWYGWYSMDVEPETYEDDCNDTPVGIVEGFWTAGPATTWYIQVDTPLK